MLFFKEIKDNKLSDEKFKAFYKKECHICSNTVKLVEKIETQTQSIDSILERLNISSQDYLDLKEGEKCNPEQVEKTCKFLKIGGPELFKSCPRK